MKKEKKEILIQKKSGETEPFDVSKLKASLRKAGAADDVIEKIAADIENRVYDGVTTDKIYAH
ncbi:MAG: ATP cone domain-containing protein, partial [Bacteroidota bacterium]